jgi:hypothetical protein
VDRLAPTLGCARRQAWSARNAVHGVVKRESRARDAHHVTEKELASLTPASGVPSGFWQPQSKRGYAVGLASSPASLTATTRIEAPLLGEPWLSLLVK